jgi:HTH-type transcriptional regulator / antitoxin HigA
MSSTKLSPAEAFPPGEYLREELDERGWTATEFAEIIGRPVQMVSEIINGKKEITTETAVAFAAAFDTSPEVWLNLQTGYRLFLHRSKADDAKPVAHRARLRLVIPLSEVKKRGWISSTQDLVATELEVCRLLEVLDITHPSQFAHAARRSNSAAAELTAEQRAWLGRVRTVARGRTVSSYDRAKLADLASRLPGLLIGGPDRLPEIRGWLADCGVVFVFLEGLRGGKLDGAVTFLPDGRPVIALTGRGDRFDGFLFTLLHECAHLVLEHIVADGPCIVDDDLVGDEAIDIEAEANDLASKWLFPAGFSLSSTKVVAILDAAEEHGVHPSVVIGRLQRDLGTWNLHRAHVPKVRSVLADDEE